MLHRNGNHINWSSYKYEDKVANVYGINDVIDIMLIGWNGKCYSVNPQIFVKIMGNNQGNTSRSNSWQPGAKQNIDQPVDSKYLERNQMKSLSQKAFMDGAGGWTKNGKSDLHRVNAVERINQASMKVKDKNYIDPNSSKSLVTEFVLGWNRVYEMSILAWRGYHSFDGFNPNDRKNWVRYDGQGASEDCYLQVMYITKQQLLFQQGFMENKTPSGVTKLLMNGSNGQNLTGSIVDTICSNRTTEYTRFDPGKYYSTDCIYSPTGKYKLLYQPDGNLVIYRSDGTSVWASKTSGLESLDYFRCPLILDQNGRLRIETGTNKTKVIMDPKHSKKTYLCLSNNGKMVIKDSQTHKAIWALGGPRKTSTNHDIFKNYFSNSWSYFEYKKTYTAPSSIYSPNLRFKLVLQSDGNLVSYDGMHGNMVWASKTNGKGITKLSVQSDGNVVLRTEAGKAVWSTGTFNVKARVFLCIDNKGIALLYAKSGNDWWCPWSAPRSSWNFIEGGINKYIEDDEPMPFTTICSSKDYVPKKSKSSILKAKRDYCLTDNNIVLDPNCNNLRNEKDVDGDSNNSYKNNVDTYVKTKVCANGYDTKYKDNPELQKLINKFCSCINPVGDSLKILNNGVHPIIYDQDCIESGYKSINTLNIKAPSCVCSNVMEFENLRLASNISQTCGAGCKNIDAGTKTKTNVDTTTSNNVNTTTGTNGADSGVENNKTTTSTTTSNNTGGSSSGSSSNTGTTTTNNSNTSTVNTSGSGNASGSGITKTNKTPTSTSNNTTIDTEEKKGLSSLQILYIVLGAIAGLFGLMIIAAILSIKPPNRNISKSYGPAPYGPEPAPRVPPSRSRWMPTWNKSRR